MAFSDLLSVTLALTLVSFIATLYVIIRTLTPLVGPHILSRYSRSTNPLPVFGYASPTPEKIYLRSAQRFQCWLAVIDLFSSAVWLWEVVSLAAGSPSSPARMAFAICARPTILLVVSLLSYMNVVRGKVVDLGKFDFIVWIPSLVLLAVMVSLAYVAPGTSATVWEVMMGVETALLAICSLCFGRLLLAVFRVRRDTVRSHMLRHRLMLEEKAAEYERALEEEEERHRATLADAPPFLPPVKTNRWLISRTFLLKKASTAANTVHTSLHRRSQSGGATLAGRPSMASELPRISLSSHGHDEQINDLNAPYSFLQHDPARTNRFGHFRAHSNSQAEAQLHASTNTATSPSLTPRAVSFDLDTAARAGSPAPPLNESRFGTLSRMTDFSRISSEQSRPSIGSFVSIDSASSESAVAGYLSSGRLANHNGKNTGLSKKEARKAGARMGGHLLGCVATWTLVLPFLIYKIHQPVRPAPFYASVLVALGLALSGPLLAIQTTIAEGGFWYAKTVPPLMASSSAVAFEHLHSRGGTPNPNLQPPHSASLIQPNSANTDITQSTAQSAATTATSSHRSTSSNSSISSLASIAAFSNPPQGTFRHSLDTQQAPSTMIGRVFAMAAPHPKLQIMKPKGARESANIENIDVEYGENSISHHDKRESRKLKSLSVYQESVTSHRERRRSNTLATFDKSWEDLEKGELGQRALHRRSALSMKDANSLTTAMLAEKKRTPPRSPSISSFTFRSSQGTSAHERRRSAPITPTSYRTTNESGVMVSPYSAESDFKLDSLTASLLTDLLPGMRVSTASVSSRRASLHQLQSRKHEDVAGTPESASYRNKKKAGLSLSLMDRAEYSSSAVDVNEGDSPYMNAARASGNDARTDKKSQHLRRRSQKSVSYTVGSKHLGTSVMPVDESNITTRRGGKARLSPAVESRHSAEDSTMPAAPRPSLDEQIEPETSHRSDEERIEILSETEAGESGLASPLARLEEDTSISSRPSIIIRTKASFTSQAGRQSDKEELGTVAMATRVLRSPSVSSFSSDGILRPMSGSSVDVNILSNHSRSSTPGSITSEGFRNMIQTNRNSWTGSELGNETSISAMLERQGALADAITAPGHARPLRTRDSNLSLSETNYVDENEKTQIHTGSQLPTPTSATFAGPGSHLSRGSFISPQRIALADVRARAQSQNDENMQPSITTDLPRAGPAPRNHQTRLPRLNGQRSIMSLR